MNFREPPRCECIDALVFADDPRHCFRCGKGPCSVVVTSRSKRMRRLPSDLGALQRQGQRPDPHMENVVRLDQLRDIRNGQDRRRGLAA